MAMLHEPISHVFISCSLELSKFSIERESESGRERER